MRRPVLAFFFLFASLALCASARAGPAHPKSRGRQQSQSSRAYDRGVLLYSKGDLPGALSSFNEAARLDPRNVPAAAAVRRIEGELREARAVARAAAPEPDSRDWAERLDDTLLSGASYLDFDDLLGECVNREGALGALNGRVAQLLMERKLALARGVPFRKDAELRRCVRRAPALS